MVTLVDSHCHLDFPEFAEEMPEILARAEAAGVAKMVTIGTRIERFERVRAIAEAHDNVYCSVGTHPHDAEQEPDVTADGLARLADHPKVVGIGESGLDFYYENSPRDAQEHAFRAHIEAARLAEVPLIVHTRGADEDTVRVLRDEYEKAPFTGLIHCFSVGAPVARAALEIGLYISIAGIVTFSKAEELRATVAELPLDRLLVETDAPFLAPVPMRGKRNEPSFVVHIAGKVADLMGCGLEELGVATTANFHRLFTKVPA
jgi:TatD DNase family protein